MQFFGPLLVFYGSGSSRKFNMDPVPDVAFFFTLPEILNNCYDYGTTSELKNKKLQKL